MNIDHVGGDNRKWKYFIFISTLVLLLSACAESDSSTDTLNVAGSNDAPQATDSSNTIAEDSLNVALNLPLPTDADVSDVLTVTATGLPNPAIGNVTLSNGSPLSMGQTLTLTEFQGLEFDTVLDATGITNFTYQVSDGSLTDNATATITVGGSNDVPIAVPNSYSTDEDTSLSGNVLTDDTGAGVDSDPEGDSLSVFALNGVPSAIGTPIILISGATLIMQPDGNFSYDPSTSAAFNALGATDSTTDSYSYTISDGNGAFDVTIVTLNITGINDAGTITVVATDTAVTEDDLANQTASGTVTISDIDTGEGVLVSSIATYGSVTESGGNWTYSLDNTNGTVQALADGETLTDTITFTSDDGATVSQDITITGINDAGTITVVATDTAVTEDDLVNQTASGTVTISDIDTGEGVLVSSIATYGSVTESGGNWTYTLDNTNGTVQALADGETLTDSIVFTSDDSTTVTQDITITGSDDAATLSIADVSVTEGNTGTVTMVFTASLSDSSSSIVSVDYATSDGSATAGIDYQSTNGTLQFAIGVTNQTIEVVVEGDTEIEPDETLIVTLSAPTNATISRSSATGTISTDDFSSLPGLDNRPDNQTCIAPARPNEDSSVAVMDPFPSLPNISQPTKMLLEPTADPRWFVLRKSGQLVTFDPDSATTISTYIDLSGIVRTSSEGGLLGMAFHPNYPNTPEIFLSYTIDHSGPPMRSVISRFILDNVSNPGAGTIEQEILNVDQDFDNHNGGDIAFGPDGYLYIGFGDGGSAGDPNNRAQNTTRLLGSMLRIDVLGPGVSHPGNPYDIPGDNPFAGNAKCGPGANANACPEIYAWGLRNPWRWSFDSDTGDLWLADVGQGAYEEVDIIELGGNYGWRCREGAHNYNSAGCGTGLVDPVSEYSHSLGNSITGGYVYRGSAIPGLIGRYVFSDYGSGRFWALQSDGQGGYTNDQLIDTSFGPTSFGVDQSGELYFTDINNSRLRKLVPAGPPTPDTIPALLSDTGCTDPTDITLPYAGLLPYDINALFWSDGAVKDRHIGLPNGTTITRNADDDWEFPNGTVIVKNFRLNGNLVETRHLMRHPDGVWAGYTYEWNAQQNEATRVQGGKTIFTNGQLWTYPSESQCMECHTSAANFALGPETSQLNKGFTYPSTSRTANQLETIDHIMMFTSPLPGPASGLPMLTDPSDSGASASERARAYLHTNCSQCHRPGGPTPSTMDLRYTTSLANTNACDALPQEGDLGIANARLIAPGDAARSLIIERATRRDSYGMPPLGSNLVDTSGINLLTTWINGLSSCN